jgi:hypothetical protein
MLKRIIEISESEVVNSQRELGKELLLEEINELAKEMRDEYYQRIRTMVMVNLRYSYEDLDDRGIEDEVNRESDRIFEAVFGEDYSY